MTNLTFKQYTWGDFGSTEPAERGVDPEPE